jgi:ATP-binding cassette subfamily B protein
VSAWAIVTRHFTGRPARLPLAESATDLVHRAGVSAVKPFDVHTIVTKRRLAGLLHLMTGYRSGYTVAALCTGIASLCQTGTYLLIRRLIDTVLPSRSAASLVAAAAGFVGLAALQGSFSFLSGTLAARTAEGTIRRLRDAFFDHVQRLPFSYLDKTPTGDLIERATSDMDAVRKFYADQAIGFGRITLLFAVNFTALCLLAWRLALASVVVLPVVLAISIVFFKIISKRYEKYQEQEAILSTTLQENLTGVRVVKAFARQAFEIERFDRVNREKFKRGRRLLMLNAAFWPATDLLCGAQMLGGFVFGALQAINGAITVGTYLAFVGMLIQLVWPIRFLGRLIVDISGGLVSYERLMTVLRVEQEPLAAGKALEDGRLRGELHFRDVAFGYEAEKPILSQISFHCAPGQSIALIGSTGSGKTSLVNLLPRFYDYTAGSVTLDGRELNGYPRHWLRYRIGIVEQEPFLFSRTIRENITYGVPGEVSDAAVEEAARSAAIHDVILSFPKGYDTLVGEKGVTLSGGQKQRVAIARTILKDPAILILDDSTSSVDTETEALIRAALERLMRGRTSFIIAHRVQSLMKADLILVFDGGRIVERGTHATLLAKEGMYHRIFDLQTAIESELEKDVSRA